MTSAISALSAIGYTPGLSAIGDTSSTGSAASIAGTSSIGSTSGVSSTSDGGFADILSGQVDALNSQQSNLDSLAQSAATGNLTDAHDYMIASTEAKLATDTVVTLKNQAVSAFTEIMRMSV